MTSPNLPRLRDFVYGLAQVIDEETDEARVLDRGAPLLADLVAHDDWLPDAFAAPDPDRYRQYLLHCDSRQRFSVVSFVWGPGQATPVHDHTVWGLIGMLRGAELAQPYAIKGEALVSDGPVHRLEPGAVEAVSPRIGDIHQVANAFDDKTSISIHVYGANIGAVRRHTYDAAGQPKLFISGYSNTLIPNLWDASAGPH